MWAAGEDRARRRLDLVVEVKGKGGFRKVDSARSVVMG